MITTSIGIIGRICSGKSTIARKLSTHFGMPILSFGAYLIEYSRENNLPTDREALQNLGNSFIKEDSGKFLLNVIAAQPLAPSSIIIEGIRHLTIQEKLSDLSNNSVFIFVEAPIEIRYKRYCSRLKEGDHVVSYEEFLKIDNHIVELEIELLREKCQITIDSNSSSDEDIIKEVVRLLR